MRLNLFQHAANIAAIMLSRREPYPTEPAHAPHVVGYTSRNEPVIKAHSGADAARLIEGQTAEGNATFAVVSRGDGTYVARRMELSELEETKPRKVISR